MSTCLIRLTFKTMFQKIAKIFNKIANVTIKRYFFITTSKFRMIIVIRDDENVLNNRMKYTQTTRFIRMIVNDEFV